MSPPDPSPPALRGLRSGGSAACRLLAMIALLACHAPLAAQTAAPTPAPTTTMVSRGLTVEVIIVVVMAGLALFAICRSSRRN